MSSLLVDPESVDGGSGHIGSAGAGGCFALSALAVSSPDENVSVEIRILAALVPSPSDNLVKTLLATSESAWVRAFL